MATGTALATTTEPVRKSILVAVASRYEMDAGAFEATLRGTIFPSNGTREEFAAFLLVANEYRLNPMTRQIYAFPKKGGGLIPVVSIDGWVHLINSHPAFDGVEFDHQSDDKGELISITCRIYRKDRKMPIVVTEFLNECYRATDPWKMKNRMLRHKALIQCGRYAFGFSGIYDEDEAERFADERKLEARRAQIEGPVAPPPPPAEARGAQPAPAAPPAPPVEDAEIVETPSPAEGGGNPAAPPAEEDDADKGEPFNAEEWLTQTQADFDFCRTPKDVDEAHEVFEDIVEQQLSAEQRRRYEDIHQAAMMRVEPEKPAAPASNAPAAPEAPRAGGQDDDDDDAGFPGNDAIKATAPKPEKSPFQIHVDRINVAMEDEDRTAAALSDLWNSTLDERKEMVAAGTMTKEFRQALKIKIGAEINRLATAEAAAASPGPAAPPPAEDDITAFDAEFRAKVAAFDNVDDLNRYSIDMMPRRKAFGEKQKLFGEWRDLVVARRMEIGGIA